MKTLSQFNEQVLTELLDNPYEYRNLTNTSTDVEYEFTTDDGRVFSVTLFQLGRFYSIVGIGDSVRKIYNDSINLTDELLDKNMHHISDVRNNEVWEVAFQDDQERTELTGEGDAFRIMATVGAILKEFVDSKIKLHGGMVTFSADKSERSRVRLYRGLLKKIEKETILNALGTVDNLIKSFNTKKTDDIDEFFETKTIQDVFAEGVASATETDTGSHEILLLADDDMKKFLSRRDKMEPHYPDKAKQAGFKKAKRGGLRR